MFLPRIILSLFLIFVAAFTVGAQKQNAENWGIADYFENLPEKYRTAHGDFAARSKDTAVVDEKNGYAAYLNRAPQLEAGDPPFPIFEMALFKSQTKSPLIVVSNRQSDSVCTDYETFFLHYDGRVWTEVKREVLPPLALKMFWDKPQSAARFLKIVERDNPTSYHFEPPRHGTGMKVSLEICNQFLEVTPIKQVDELEQIIKTTKPIRLEWDKQKGKFKLAK